MWLVVFISKPWKTMCWLCIIVCYILIKCWIIVTLHLELEWCHAAYIVSTSGIILWYFKKSLQVLRMLVILAFSCEAVNDNIFLFSLNIMMIAIKEKHLLLKKRVMIVIQVVSHSQGKGITLLQTLVMIPYKKLLHPTTVKMWMKRKKKMNMLSLVAM